MTDARRSVAAVLVVSVAGGVLTLAAAVLSPASRPPENEDFLGCRARGRIFTVEAHVRDMKSGEWAYVSHGDANVLVVRLDGHAMSLDGIRFGLDVALASPMFGSRRETEAWAADRPARRETRGP